jgi:hypothetical protein
LEQKPTWCGHRECAARHASFNCGEPRSSLGSLAIVGGDAPCLVAGQTDGSPSMVGIALQMPVNRAGAVEYEN